MLTYISWYSVAIDILCELTMYMLTEGNAVVFRLSCQYVKVLPVAFHVYVSYA